MSFITSDLHELVADLEAAGPTVKAGIRPIVVHGVGNIQRGARERVKGLKHAPAYPASITYDVDITATSVVGEVGPDKDLPQGALGNLIEFGSTNNAPIPHLEPALDDEAPKFAAAILLLSEKAF